MTDRIPNLDALLGRHADDVNAAELARCSCGGLLDIRDADALGRLIEHCQDCGHRRVIVARRMVTRPPAAPGERPAWVSPVACACGCDQLAQPWYDARHGTWRPAPKYATPACRGAASSARAAGHAARLRAAGTLVTVNVRGATRRVAP
jgi:hypothetical protein